MEIREDVVSVSENDLVTRGTEYNVGNDTWCASLFIPNASKKAKLLYIQTDEEVNEITLNGRQIRELIKLLALLQ